MSSDKRGTRILARTFFNQLRSSGYTSHQILDIATELIDLVTSGIRDAEKTAPVANNANTEASRRV
jgi:hypothetical protein